MRLLRPSPGEAADRQTILHLKAKYGQLKKINVRPFNEEINAIQDYLQKEWFYKITEAEGQKYNALFEKLKDVNNQLWRIEDEVRIRVKKALDDVNKTRLVEIAIEVPKLNDQRSDLVSEINRLFLVVEQEKVYLVQ